MGLDDANVLISEVPTSVEQILVGATGTERHPDLGWSVGAYVCHVADNLHIWAERLAGSTAGAGGVVGAYDQDLLAVARGYERIPLAAAKWSLRQAVAELLEVVARPGSVEILLLHPERGGLTLSDIACATAHDAHHHLWDIHRSLEAVAN
jgi:hypothetical protein